MKKLIGLNGFKESGKDTTYHVAKDFFIDQQELVIARAGFADKLKLMAARALGFTEQDMGAAVKLMDEAKESWVFEVTEEHHDQVPGTATPLVSTSLVSHFTGRQYLQWFGGEARGVFGENFWIDQVLPKANASTPQDLDERYPGVDILFITDVRYPNEAERVKQLGGEVWEIVKPDRESDGHASEQPLPRELVDLTLLNDGTIDALRSLVGNSL